MPERKLRPRRIALLIAVLAVIAVFAAVSFSDSGCTDLGAVSNVSLPGASGEFNTVGLAFGGRYAVIAPFAPVNGDDNHYIDIVDTQNPSASPIQKNLGKCFYPSNLIVTAQNAVFVRASFAGSSDGSLPPAEVIEYYQLQDSNGKVHLDNSSLRSFDIATVPGADPTLTPTSFGVGNQGKILVYTNGASIHAISLAEGYDYPVDLIPETSYQPQTNPNDPIETFDAITNLSVDSNDMVTVTVSGRYNAQNFSQLYFYKLNEDPGPSYGTLDLVKLVDKGQFPNGATMTPGSNAVVTPDGRLGFFALDDGSLCSVRLAGDITTPKITVLGQYEGLAAPDPTNRGGRFVGYDPSGPTVSVVKKGTVVVNVRRPAYGHGRNVRRPAYLKVTESPAAVLAQLGADGTVSNAQEYVDFGPGEQEISMIVFDGKGNSFLSTGAGNFVALSGSGVQVLGAAAPRIGEMVLDSNSSNFVGISSFDFDSDSNITSPGSLVIMSLAQNSGTGGLVSLFALPHVSLIHSVAAGIVIHIRRPCS